MRNTNESKGIIGMHIYFNEEEKEGYVTAYNPPILYIKYEDNTEENVSIGFAVNGFSYYDNNDRVLVKKLEIEYEKQKKFEIEKRNWGGISREEAEKRRKEEIIKKKQIESKERYELFLDKVNKEWEEGKRFQARYKEETKRIIMEREIEKLVHITPMENIQRIIEEGIKPRDVLEHEYRSYTFLDNDRYDGKKSCISLTIETKNKHYLKDKRADAPNGFATIIINAQLLVEEDYKRYYCYCNAAVAEVSEKNRRGEGLAYPKDFEFMFNDVIEYKTASGGRRKYRSTSQKKNITTDDQAEILFSGIIDRKYIERIEFENEPSKAIINLLENVNIPYTVDSLK